MAAGEDDVVGLRLVADVEGGRGFPGGLCGVGEDQGDDLTVEGDVGGLQHGQHRIAGDLEPWRVCVPEDGDHTGTLERLLGTDRR